MHPKNLSIKDYTYHLPDDKIAKYPLAERDQSKLLVYKNGAISESVYREIAGFLPADSVLIFNNTKVIHARLFFENQQGAKIEIFCLEPLGPYTEMVGAMAQKGSARWNCMVGRASKWKEKVLTHRTNDLELTAEMVDRTADAFVVEFKWHPENLTFAEVLDKTGMMPIPPYLHRPSEVIDENRYQTLFAKHEGSVAAPTAGLHFTKRIFDSLKEKEIKTTEVTLHVGAGTFKPVKSENMAGHEMHAELIDVSIDTIEELLEHINGNIIAVGTTSLRTIESLFWMGVKAIQQPKATLEILEIQQWYPYEINGADFAPADALSALLAWMMANNLRRLICKTQILIAPGYKLKVAKGLVTNFHQPNSTLLLLVAAIVGDDWRRIYDYAINNNFRFLSYGDGSLLMP